MLELLIQFIFNIVNQLVSTLMSPLINLVTALFPDLTGLFSTIGTYFTTFGSYVISCSHLLLIPDSFWQLLFTYIEIKYSIYIGLVVVRGTMRLYNYFKP